MTQLPEATTAIRSAVVQNPPPAQHNNQSTASTELARSIPNLKRSSTANSLSRLASSSGVNPAQLAEMKPTKTLSEDNWVRVRIWTSKTEKGQDTYSADVILRRVKNLNANIGHATLETNGIYASIWPDQEAENSARNASYFMPTVQGDIQAENGKPDYVFEFYSLDKKAIEETFKKIKEAKEPWTLFGDSFGGTGYSCSSLTLALLEKGGLNNLATMTTRGIVSPTSNFVVSPNNLVNQLSLAKKLEEKNFPQTVDFYTKDKKNSTAKNEFIVTIKAEKVTIFNPKDPVTIQDNNGPSNKFSR